jgi:hypothetical protein
MEQKRFGVKNSRIEELRLFQLTLQQKRLKMPFTRHAEVFVGEEYTQKMVTASQRTITIEDCAPLQLNNFRLPRQPLRIQNERELKLRISDTICITIRFATEEDKSGFIRALGNLDPE